MTDDTKPKRHRRLAAIIAAGVVAVISLGFLGTGAMLLWADSEGDRDGYIATDTERFKTDARALATENLDVDLDGPEGLLDGGTLGKLRIEAASNGGKPVFVGIARTSEVEDYLRGSAHDIVTDVEFSPFHVDYSTQAGARTPAPPAQQGFWAASTDGQGDQALTWDVEDGDWSVVVMNADGSRGVDAGVSAGVRVGWLDEAGLASLGTGLILLAFAGGLVFVGVRSRPRAASAAA